jgi:TPR repeat protein
MMPVELCQSNSLTLSGVIVAVLLSVGSALAGTSEDCRAAYHRQDYAEALRLGRPLAEQGADIAQTTLGILYERGLGGLAQDDAEAVKGYRKAAEQGVAYAQDRLALMYRQGRGGLPQDYAEAAKWVRKSAEQGDAMAQAYLGSGGLAE